MLINAKIKRIGKMKTLYLINEPTFGKRNKTRDKKKPK